MLQYSVGLHVFVNGPDYFFAIHDRNIPLKKFPQSTARKVDFPSVCQALLHILGVKHILAKVGFRVIKIPSYTGFTFFFLHISQQLNSQLTYTNKAAVEDL